MVGVRCMHGFLNGMSPVEMSAAGRLQTSYEHEWLWRRATVTPRCSKRGGRWMEAAGTQWYVNNAVSLV